MRLFLLISFTCSMLLCSIFANENNCTGKTTCFDNFITEEKEHDMYEKYGEDRQFEFSASPFLSIEKKEEIILENPSNAEAHYRLSVLYSLVYENKDTFKTYVEMKCLANLHFVVAYEKNAYAYYRLGKLYEIIGKKNNNNKKLKEFYKELSLKHYDFAAKLGYQATK